MAKDPKMNRGWWRTFKLSIRHHNRSDKGRMVRLAASSPSSWPRMSLAATVVADFQAKYKRLRMSDKTRRQFARAYPLPRAPLSAETSLDAICMNYMCKMSVSASHSILLCYGAARASIIMSVLMLQLPKSRPVKVAFLDVLYPRSSCLCWICDEVV
jgi:hypothetical protein